jgi:hypothetical protein
MLYVSGLQGQGKSSVVRKLFGEVLGDMYSEQELKDALDTRSAESKQNYYFMLIDEISHLDMDTVAKLKKLLTSSSENTRVLGTNAVMNVKNNLTVAATSNFELMSTIYDESGARRFWELKLNIPEGGMVNWDNLAKIDIKALWKSIDPHSEGHYGRHMKDFDRMKEHQAESVPKSYAEVFLYVNKHIDQQGVNMWLKGADLYRNYKTWATDNGISNTAHNSIWFTKKLSQMKVESKEVDRATYFLLKEGPANNTAVPVVEEDGKATGAFHKKDSVTAKKEV